MSIDSRRQRRSLSRNRVAGIIDSEKQFGRVALFMSGMLFVLTIDFLSRI